MKAAAKGEPVQYKYGLSSIHDCLETDSELVAIYLLMMTRRSRAQAALERKTVKKKKYDKKRAMERKGLDSSSAARAIYGDATADFVTYLCDQINMSHFKQECQRSVADALCSLHADRVQAWKASSSPSAKNLSPARFVESCGERVAQCMETVVADCYDRMVERFDKKPSEYSVSRKKNSGPVVNLGNDDI